MYSFLFSVCADANREQNVTNIVFPFYMNTNRKQKRVYVTKLDACNDMNKKS